MTKKLKRTFAFLLSLCLVLGSLSGLSLAKTSTRSGGGFAVGESGRYVIAAKVNNVYYGMSNAFSGKILGSELTVVDGYVSEEEAVDYAVQLSYDGSSYTIQNDTHYLAYSSSTNFGSSTTAYAWNISAGLNGSWRITASTATTRGLLFRAKTYLQFGAYALSNAKAGSEEYYDVEILPIGSVADATEEVFVRVKNAADITAGRYVLLVEPTKSDSSYQYYMVDQSEDSSYYALHVAGTSLTSLPETLKAGESMIWTLDGTADAFRFSGSDGRFLYNDPNTPVKLEYSSTNSCDWTASYDSSKQAFTLKATYYLSFRDDSTYIGDNDLPLVFCTSNTTNGNAYFHLYKSEAVVNACAHVNKESNIVAASCTTDGRSTITCKDCGRVLGDQILSATGHSFRYVTNVDGTHEISCTKCDYTASANCNVVNGSCTFCGWSDGSVSLGSFQLITSENQITDGQYVLVVAPGGANPGSYPYYAISRQMHGSSYVMAEGMDLDSIPQELSASVNTIIWNLAGNSSGFTLSGGDGSVLYHTNNNLYYGSGTATTWVPTFENGTFLLSDASRYLGLRDDLTTVASNNNPCFRCNSSAKTSSYQFYLFKSGTVASPECTHKNTSQSLVPSTCTDPGTLTTLCSDCGIVVKSEAVEPLGHNASYVEGAAAGCNTEGRLAHYICTRCKLYFSDALCSNEIKASATIVAPIGHDVKAVGGIEATCGTEGMLAHYICYGCDAYFLDQDATKEVSLTDLTIPALGHKTIFTPATAATCAADGNTAYYTCEDCDCIFSDAACTNQIVLQDTVIAALNHTPDYYPVVEASCTETGIYAYYYCDICNIYYSDIECTEIITENDLIIPPHGHDILFTDRIEPACTEQGSVAHYYCSRCDLLFSDKNGSSILSEEDVSIPATGHSYVNSLCSVCGAKEATVDTAMIINHSLNLASDISLNYVVRSSLLTNYDSFYLECVIPEYSGNTLTGTNTVILQPVLNGSLYYFTLYGITAVQMNDTIEATLYMTKGEELYCSNPDLYSVTTYAYSQLNKPNTGEALRRLCANLLSYGTNTQLYKGYRTDHFSDAAMTEAHKAYLTDLDTVTFQNNRSYGTDLASPSVRWIGQALNLDSKITIKFVCDITNYEGNLDDLNLKIRYVDCHGVTQNVTIRNCTSYAGSNVAYSFDFNGLMAAELRQVLTVAFYDGDVQVSQTLKYSADTYGNGKTGNLLLACKAMMAYSDAALAYFQST